MIFLDYMRVVIFLLYVPWDVYHDLCNACLLIDNIIRTDYVIFYQSSLLLVFANLYSFSVFTEVLKYRIWYNKQ